LARPIVKREDKLCVLFVMSNPSIAQRKHMGM
jgi:hypothetical protein